MSKPTVISTFAGCGGSSLGYRQAGYRELLAVECDNHAVACLRANWPRMPIYHGDIANLSIEQTLELAKIQPKELDVLDGSPPCQGFSTAGNREVADTRNSLFGQYARLLAGLKPKVFVAENVVGMIKGPMRGIFCEILDMLRGCGYRVRAEILNAMYYATPQSRQRIIIIGTRKDTRRVPSFPCPQTQPISVSRALREVTIDETERQMLLVAGQRYASFVNWHDLPRGKNYRSAGLGSSFSAIRVHPNKPCVTVCKKDGTISANGLMHWNERRRFTIAEYRCICGFPNDYRFVGTWKEIVSRMGNCVPPPLMRAIAEHIRDTILV